MSNTMGLFCAINSPTVAGTPPTPTDPSAPTLVSAVAGSASVSLSWLPPASTGYSAITSYEVWRGTTSGGETSLVTGLSASLLTYTDTTATDGTTWYYTIVAVNGVGSSSESNERSADPFTPTAPDAPTLTACIGGVGMVTLGWTPGSDNGSTITSFELERSTSSGTETTLTTGISGSATSWTDSSSIVAGTTYYYKLKAVNGVGTSAASNELFATASSSPPLTLIQGLYTGSLSSTESLASRLTMTLSGYSTYCTGDSWGSIGSFSPPTLPPGVTLLLGVNLTPNATGISAVAGHLATFEGLASNLIGTPTICRLGWEFDGNWFPWGNGVNANTPAQFATATALVINAMKAVNPDLKFDMSCNTGTSTLAQLEVYLGSNASLWDYIGGDHYDTSSGGSDTFAAFGPVVNLANLHGIPISVGEWGLNDHEDTDFIDDAAQFILDPAGASSRYGWPSYTVGYHSYFSADLRPGINSDITDFTSSLAEFQTNFS